ncbi:MAG: quinone-interacting membrane-bound oxidoreductase complex subunit QmoC [Proteobacteria bacterium]|nr:quinone-interacting membrane-bound oxidoreductase complex subunit QmoC [Pseudomonadota bacterium]MBU1717319.1 quinone-interacting membrane-bound oxidoreductase complex subunit QmoC [Pseudomonadota bacterium]
MAEGMRVEPDLNFIKFLKNAGGDTLKKCYQCATCSVVCPLSSDDNPFPRKEMISAQWGLKDKLIGDVNVMLCHQCGDCTAYCPRGAKPGDVLGAIRAYAYTHFGFPQGLAKLCSSGKNLPMLIGMPILLIGILFFLANGGMHLPDAESFKEVGFGHFFGHWDLHFLTKNVVFIDAIFLPAVAFALFATFRGVSNMWKEMEKSVNADTTFRPSALQFAKDFLWPSLVEIIQHKRFNECGENKNRVNGHLPLVLAFIGLFIVTNYAFVVKDIIGYFVEGLHGPIALANPIKILANVSAIAMIIGIAILWANRSNQEEKTGASGTFYDWFLIGEIMAVGVTGLGAELLRLAGLVTPAYLLYFMHLVSVFMLFLYMPYTKFAHMAYRTFAMAFEKYRESGFVKQ